MIFSYKSQSLEDTLSFGKKIGSRLKGGEVFELNSDLGGGKTAFVRGLAYGIGSEDEISSPSFTLNNQYVGTGLRIEHFDFYRLSSAGVVADELKEFLGAPDTVVAVEWGDIVHDVLPKERVTITISVDADDERTCVCEYPQTLLYLFEGAIL